MIMGTGLVCNIILDACFTMIIPMGLAGAALATITAQSLTVAGSLACLLKDRAHPVRRSHFRLQKRMMARMLKIGVSPFGLSLMPSVITIYNNLQCLAYGGDLAVSAYAVINYFIGSVLLLLEGVGEGMQPLISYASGAGDYGAMKRLKNKGLMTVLVFSALFLIACVPRRFSHWHIEIGDFLVLFWTWLGFNGDMVKVHFIQTQVPPLAPSFFDRFTSQLGAFSFHFNFPLTCFTDCDNIFLHKFFSFIWD